MPRKVVAHVPPPLNKKICCFCSQREDNELVFGKFHEYDGIVTHYYCLLLSSNMQQNGEDEEGILGFLPEDINKELKRGKRLVCYYCKKSGATLGCCNTKCKKIFHFPCGLKSGSLHQFFGEFRSYCRNHRPKQKIDERVAEEVQRRDDMICYICYDEVNPHDMYGTLWAPCCKKNAWFHRGCVQQLAMSAGYFFKCPLCNNKTDFQKAMLDQGIFIPSQDASWELVPNAFEELLYRHNRCDAENCLCPKGREHTSSNAKWELTLCRTCGSQGIHMACGQLKWVKPIWECSECISILNKTASSDSESSFVLQINRHSRRLRGYEISNSDDTKDDNDASSDSDISVGTETMEASTSDSTPSKIRDDESLGRKSPEEPVALRITRRSVIPIPKSPVTTRIPTPKYAAKNEDLPPERKRPRLADSVVDRESCVSVDSDDDIVVISGPSRSENEGSKENKSKHPVEKLADNSRSPEKTPKIDELNPTKESQEPTSKISSIPHETTAKPSHCNRLSTNIEKKVVEIDLSELECTIPEARPNSIADVIPAPSSMADPPEFNFMITNVTSLAPEAFESVPEQKEEPKEEPTKVTPRVFDEKSGGLTSQTPIVLDDEPLPVAPTSHAADNNNLHLSATEIHDQMKIIRFENPPDNAGNPTNSIVYGITIPGTNQTLPLIFTASENDGSKAPSASPMDVNRSSAVPGDCIRTHESPIISAPNNSSISLTAVSAVPNATPESSQSPMSSRIAETSSAPKSGVSSLSISVPLKAIVNERFPGSRAVRKSIDGGGRKFPANNRGSPIKTTGIPLAPKPPVLETPQPLPKGSFVRMPKSSIFPMETLPDFSRDSLPKAPAISSNGSSAKPLAGPRSSKSPAQSKAPTTEAPNQIDASTLSKVFAILPPESCGQPKAQTPAVPNGLVTSNIPKPRPAIRPNAKPPPPPSTANGNFPNANITWLHSDGSVLKIDAVNTNGPSMNLNPLTQLHIQKSAASKPPICEPQLFQLIRTDKKDASTDDCDGDAGSGPAGQPASVYNSTNPRPRCDAPCKRDASPEVGKLPATEDGRTSAAMCDSDSDDATDSSASSDWSDAGDRAGLIYKSVNLRDLKFSICGSNIVQMTVYDTYTVNIEVDASSPCMNSKYSSLRRTSKNSLGREARHRSIARSDSKDFASLLDTSAGAVDDDNDTPLNQSECSQENVSIADSASRTNDSPGIDVPSRSQDELKENLDPVPSTTNSNHSSTNTVDRKSKLRLHTCVNQSMRSLNENEGQQVIDEKSEKKVAAHEPQSVHSHTKVSYNGWKDNGCHEETNAQYPLPGRSVETVAKNAAPRSSVDDNFFPEDLNQIHASKRKRISVSDECPVDMQNYAKSTTTKEPNDCNDVNTNHLVRDPKNAKHMWKSSDDVGRTREIHENSLTGDRASIASGERVSCKVSIDLSRIRTIFARKLNISGKNWGSKMGKRYAKSKDWFVSKSALSRSKSIDNLTFDRGEDSIDELRRSKSASDLSSSSSRSSVDKLAENRMRGRKRKRRSFEEHDCVR